MRNADWVKLRFVRSGEFVVIGWEAAAERPDELSSLLLGRYRGGLLSFAGKVGSGLDVKTAARLRGELAIRHDCVLDVQPPASAGRVVRWCEASVVVEVQFALWTQEGRLRHPVFRAIRTDKVPEEATGE